MSTAMSVRIENGLALVDGRWSAEPLALRGALLADDAAGGVPTRVIDASGLLVLPGIVDIHGDAFERHIMPRPGVRFDTTLALRDTDRQLVANGITTAFHGVTISWEPGLRSVEAARAFVATLMALRGGLACDTRLHLRWETFALEAMEEVRGWLALDPAPILAFNDHTSGSVLKGTIARKIGQMAERSGLSQDDYRALLDRVWGAREDVPAAIVSLAASARANGNVLLAHDENSPDERARFRALGAVASEFPMNPETAQAARDAGEDVILGAPNVVRGGSHNGAQSAGEAVAAGRCTVLTSDYHYPSPLYAAFTLAAGDRDALARHWPLISANPARVARLEDRGRLAPGQRADLILVDASDMAHPEVVATLVEGRIVYARRAVEHRPVAVAAQAAE
ncbi:alpha-D-ribose 1-methylphosphonate 5-triphosphate diphosphatase [Ancylobacter polymorphus]|uniref:Alpha-D-ribose 1-methylphosphonate 5-triphosphate diphosphatase n=1 Tax=Ancylobacter polymorphus TaxID=223390 RepID=A0ABU0BFJ4_9HYPH|nr:alpha-D-ribose 1-methylphosphonate 5-triphosphate diphosphatase [Ancylobacter polymorphus]MDQ0304590.1 alpha-D-ribose 1-methylphosphonate 5-triphosphate diphosphatase [Ancylobacter polymorphus]